MYGQVTESRWVYIFIQYLQYKYPTVHISLSYVMRAVLIAILSSRRDYSTLLIDHMIMIIMFWVGGCVHVRSAMESRWIKKIINI